MEETPVAEARARARFVRMSPTKVRAVLDLVRGRPVAEAEAILAYVPRRAARVVAKVVRAARASAVHNLKLDEERLIIVRAFADGGPMLKRIQPHMRGQAFRIRRRMAHVTVVVREAPEPSKPAPKAAAAAPSPEVEAAPEGEKRRPGRRPAPGRKPAGARGGRGAETAGQKGSEPEEPRRRTAPGRTGGARAGTGKGPGGGKGRGGTGRAGRKGG